jgi:hypothetical protein
VRRDAGFSLVEIMIGTLLIAVGLLGIMESCTRLHDLQRLDTEIGMAYNACRSNLEQLHDVPLAELEALDGKGFVVPGADGATPGLRAVPGDPDGLPGEIHVSLVDTAAGRSLYRIRAAVSWYGSSKQHAIELTTLRGGTP